MVKATKTAKTQVDVLEMARSRIMVEIIPAKGLSVMTDREALLALYAFLTTKRYVTMDGDSLHDMVTRYQNPPLTALNTVAMQMTTKEYNALAELMKEVSKHLKESDIEQSEPV